MKMELLSGLQGENTLKIGPIWSTLMFKDQKKKY
jgi:hypothetical protein